MKKGWKKVLSFVMALALLAGMSPGSFVLKPARAGVAPLARPYVDGDTSSATRGWLLETGANTPIYLHGANLAGTEFGSARYTYNEVYIKHMADMGCNFMRISMNSVWWANDPLVNVNCGWILNSNMHYRDWIDYLVGPVRR